MAFTELEVSATLLPAQMVVGLPDIVGVAGTALIVATAAVLVDDTHPVVVFLACA